MDDWNDMASAPRDGTVIELRSTYGPIPWYGLYRWTTQCYAFCSDLPDNKKRITLHEPAWVETTQQMTYTNEEGHTSWRPAPADLSTYPTPSEQFDEHKRIMADRMRDIYTKNWQDAFVENWNRLQSKKKHPWAGATILPPFPPPASYNPLDEPDPASTCHFDSETEATLRAPAPQPRLTLRDWCTVGEAFVFAFLFGMLIWG